MPYEKFTLKGPKPFALKNVKTDKVYHYDTPQARDEAIRIREAFAHGWKPKKKKGLAAASIATRKRVASIGGRSH